MGRQPLRVILVAEGGGAGTDTYLGMLLAVHGRFHVLDDGDDDGHDAVLVATSSLPHIDGAQAAGAPVIVLPQWRPESWEVEAMVEDGAEDVLPMSELSAERLEAVVRKAIGRRSRAARTIPRIPLREVLPEALAGHGPAWASVAPMDPLAVDA